MTEFDLSVCLSLCLCLSLCASVYFSVSLLMSAADLHTHTQRDKQTDRRRYVDDLGAEIAGLCVCVCPVTDMDGKLASCGISGQ